MASRSDSRVVGSTKHRWRYDRSCVFRPGSHVAAAFIHANVRMILHRNHAWYSRMKLRGGVRKVSKLLHCRVPRTVMGNCSLFVGVICGICL